MKKFFAALLLVSFCVVVIAQSGTQNLGDRLFVNSSSHPSPSVIIGPHYAPWLAISSSGFTGTLASSLGGSFPMLAPDGTSTAPSYSFTNATGGGLYLNGTTVILGGAASSVGVGNGNSTIISGGGGGSTSGAGGNATLMGGVATTDGVGGSAIVQGRNGAGTNRAGGSVTLTAGNGIGTGNGANIVFNTGTSPSGAYGVVRWNTDVIFANLPAASNGSMVYCSDCTIASPCAGSGTGAFAKRLNGVWVCN